MKYIFTLIFVLLFLPQVNAAEIPVWSAPDIKVTEKYITKHLDILFWNGNTYEREWKNHNGKIYSIDDVINKIKKVFKKAKLTKRSKLEENDYIILSINPIVIIAVDEDINNFPSKNCLEIIKNLSEVCFINSFYVGESHYWISEETGNVKNDFITNSSSEYRIPLSDGEITLKKSVSNLWESIRK